MACERQLLPSPACKQASRDIEQPAACEFEGAAPCVACSADALVMGSAPRMLYEKGMGSGASAFASRAVTP